MTNVRRVFEGRDGAATNALYDALFLLGPGGAIAVNLLRIAKNSKGGKNTRYSKRGRNSAYDSKDWAMGELCRALRDGADQLGMNWGWGYDSRATGYEHVLYVDLPGQGQVSFHTHTRRDGHDYDGTWDGVKDVSALRCIAFAQFLINQGDDHVTVTAGTERTAGETTQGEPAAEEGQKALDL